MIKDVSIEIIQRCLNRCLHCSSCSTSESVAVLSKDIVKEVVDGLHILGTQRICLSGGEPFLHPDAAEIIEYISQKGIVVDVYSCGILGDKDVPSEIPLSLLSKLKSAGLRSIIFNLPSASEDTYNFITQTNGHFPLLIESIKNTVASEIIAEVHFVPMSVNRKDASSMVTLAEQLGIRQINFLKLVPHGRARENYSELSISDAELVDLQNELLTLQEKGKPIRIGLPLSVSGTTPPCHAVSKKLYIKFDGSVFGCEAFKYIVFHTETGGIIKPNNIHTESVLDIYKHSTYLRESKKLVNHYSSCTVGCENCPVQKYIKTQEAYK